MTIETVYANTYEQKPIITNAAHCGRALALASREDIYFGLGKTSPWEGNEDDTEFVPPMPDINATNLEELIGLKKADRISLVEPSETGEIEYAGIRFKTLSREQALESKARWIMLEVTIQFSELPPVSYRQIGVFSHVKPKAEKANSAVLLPNDIEDIGILEILNNRKVVTRQSDTKDTYFMVIEC